MAKQKKTLLEKVKFRYEELEPSPKMLQVIQRKLTRKRGKK